MWVNIYILLLFSNFSQSKLQPLKKEEKTTPKSRLNGSINKNSINIYITEKMNIYPKFLQDLVLFHVTFDYLEEICKHVKQKPHSFIIFEDDLNKLSNALTLVLSSELVTGNTKYIVLTTLKENIKELGELLWKFRLPYGHIFFLNSHDMKVYRLDVKKCGSDINVKRMETNKHLLNYPLRQEFNIKSAFKKCPLYIIWAIMPPMVIGVNESLPGIYIELMKVFEIASGRKLIYRPYDQIYTEEISSSYSFGTLLEDFAKEYAEIFVGSIDQYTIGMFDITPVLWSNNILLLIPRTISNVWESLIPQLVVIQFFFGLGLLFGISLIFYYLAKVTIDRYMYTSLTKVYLMLFGIVLGVPCLHRNPKTQILRIYFGSFLLQSLVISTYIQGSIVGSLSGSIYGPPIENAKELLKSNIPIKVLTAMQLLFNIAKDQYDTELAERIEILENLTYVEDVGNLAIEKRNFATTLDTGFIMTRPNILKSFSVFPVLNLQQSIGMPKNAFFSRQYQRWFQRILEMGIMSKYMKLYEFNYALKHYVNTKKRVYQFNLKQIMPVFFILFRSYKGAFLIFLLENLIYRLNLHE